MARTKASVGSKISSGKSSKARCSAAPAATTVAAGASDKPSRSAGGGNPVCPRETPKWQRPINTFFISKDGQQPKEDDDADDIEAGSSGTGPKECIIESDEDAISDPAPNGLELQALKAAVENSHKIDEYFSKGAKGKGVGKKTKGKENGEMEDKTERDNKSKAEHLSNNIKGRESTSRRTNGKKSANEIEDNSHESDKDSDVKESSASETEDRTEGDDESENENCSKEVGSSKNKGKSSDARKRERDDESDESDKDSDVNESSASETEDRTEEDDKSDKESSKVKSSKTIGKRSDASARERDDESDESDKENGVKERSKREREDRIEEGRVSKKIRVN